MQHFTTIVPGATAGIPLDTPTIAELFTDAGYSSHMVGKWHLGYSSWAQTPTRRGFKSYLGYLQGQTDYYNRTLPSCGAMCLYKSNQHKSMPAADGYQGEAYDFWEDDMPVFDQFGDYTSESYMNRVDQIINQHNDTAEPLFLYYAEQQLHIPIEPPPEPKHLEACRGVTGGSAVVNRTVLCSMASKLDESVGRLVDSLKKAEMWENTLIWAVSDNGGMTHWGDVFPASASSNWPLRGGKATLFEGGVRSVSFLAGGFLPSTHPSHYDSLLHVSDIMPTLSSVAGVKMPENVPFDGINAWPDLFGKPGAARRTEVPLNIDTNPISVTPHLLPHAGDGLANFSATISWPWKLILGTTCNPGVPNAEQAMDGWWTVKNYSRILPPAKDWDRDEPAMLFNLETDEQERHNVASQYPEIVANMTSRLQGYWASKGHGFRRAQPNIPMPLANPKLHNWTWSPFRPSLRHSQYYKHQQHSRVQEDFDDQ